MKTDTQPFGPDTFIITVEQKIVGNPNFCTTRSQGELKSEGINQAQAKCKEMKKQFMPVSSTISGFSFSRIYELTFRCLDEDDPELKRPDKGTEIIEPPDRSPTGLIVLPPLVPPK